MKLVLILVGALAAAGVLAWHAVFGGDPSRRTAVSGDLFTDVWRPSGMSHYCGEHTSLKHGWIEGAVESAIRCATEICARIAADPGLIEKHEASKGPEFV